MTFHILLGDLHLPTMNKATLAIPWIYTPLSPSLKAWLSAAGGKMEKRPKLLENINRKVPLCSYNFNNFDKFFDLIALID